MLQIKVSGTKRALSPNFCSLASPLHSTILNVRIEPWLATVWTTRGPTRGGPFSSAWRWPSPSNYTDRQERQRVACTDRETESQATEVDWLTKARDFKCAEPLKNRPPSYVPVISAVTSSERANLSSHLVRAFVTCCLITRLTSPLIFTFLYGRYTSRHTFRHRNDTNPVI
jgi:hypothetical protein